jgi:predicted esterase
MTQETLEEAAKQYAKQYALSTRHISHIGFEDGAKYMAKTMYSEEELKNAFKIGFNIGYGSPVSELDLKEEHCTKWFEQFKKK